MTDTNGEDKTYSCYFLRHRDEVKFENFEDNHPALYLPFVSYNVLLLSILPKIHHDNIQVELSRRTLLQDEQLSRHLLTVLVNTILNINIVLDETVYRDAVRTLKNIDLSITSNVELVRKFLYLETYMTNKGHKEQYLKGLSRHTVTPVFESRFLVPSPSFYRTYINILPQGQNYWGPAFWTVVHLSTYVIDNVMADREDYKEVISGLSGFFDLILPCSMCGSHYRSQDDDSEPDITASFKRPFPLTLPYLAVLFASKNRLFEFYSKLHNRCKPKTEDSKITREELGLEYYLRVYRSHYLQNK